MSLKLHVGAGRRATKPTHRSGRTSANVALDLDATVMTARLRLAVTVRSLVVRVRVSVNVRVTGRGPEVSPVGCARLAACRIRSGATG